MKIKLLPVFIAILFGLTGYLNKRQAKPKLVIKKQDSAFNFNEDLLQFLAVGQSRLLSDILWITTLLESDLDHYKKRDLNSWLFYRFNSITKLDPLFYRAYLFGGQYLSIVKDDLFGAKEIYLKGLEKFPNDKDLLFNAGFLFAFEMRDYEIAIPIYERLLKLPNAPSYLVSFLQKIKYESNTLNLEDTARSIKDILRSLDKEKEDFLYSSLSNDLFRIQAQLDLECLNSGKSSCNKVDLRGKPYLLIDGSWQTVEPFQEYGIQTKD